jgi:hypothetical protein
MKELVPVMDNVWNTRCSAAWEAQDTGTSATMQQCNSRNSWNNSKIHHPQQQEIIYNSWNSYHRRKLQ